MNIVIILLTFILIVSSLFLILLVLVQLPKKEAGLGQAFGSGATDALFGPGSGNMLTKMTKWTAAIFFTLTLFIWILQGHNARARGLDPRSRFPAEKAAAEKAGGPVSTNVSTNMNLLLNAASNTANSLTATNVTNSAVKPAAPANPATPPGAAK
ncbi:MAG: preprotein translocase subunit SecG [Verrucomicrobiota bacterium]